MKSVRPISANFLFSLIFSTFAASTSFAGPLSSTGGMEQLLASCGTPTLTISVVSHSGTLGANVRRDTANGVGVLLMNSNVEQVAALGSNHLEFATVDADQIPFDLVIDLPADYNGDGQGNFTAVMRAQLNGSTLSVKQVTCSFAQAPLK